ncbi:MarR family winged helix-turn-helix transcriptional regulator [Bythopirellula polymerisocia]|uniref:Transcriptional regulator SlyA n=1 Tax=Bythopirellula polymerisocia TaxID=2528003 RepID=A0A5C6CH88_9BACT|nr:MarR family transcriptional regulator [Bythopirellula polymerisocia]TWU22586.1 Transcriptional regulator SlyA [Bythopirellula polymerisocia]
MLKYDFEESLGYWLTMTHHAYMRAFNEELAPEGITYRQAQVLAWLALEGPMPQADLASRMLIEPPSLVGTLDRMEASKLIKRCSCPSDGRKKLVQTLPEADALWEKIVVCGRRIRAVASAGLSDREIATLKKLLGKVQANVSSGAHEKCAR